MQTLKFISIFITIVLLSSCGNYLNKKTIEPVVELSNEESKLLDFKLIKESIFAPRCISCHQQYDNYQGVFRELNAIHLAVTSNRMPKSGGPLSDHQKALLSAWVDLGAPEQTGSVPAEPSIPEVLTPTWKSLSENVFFPKCLACHNSNGQAKFLVLSSRQLIFNNRNKIYSGGSKFIDLEFPEKSYLLEVLGDEEEPMPPKESNIPRLTMDELKTIQKWISLGLP